MVITIPRRDFAPKRISGASYQKCRTFGEPNMIREMPICFWICFCSTGNKAAPFDAE
jgi:hypothetical protein